MKRWAILSIMVLCLVSLSAGKSLCADQPAGNTNAASSLSGKVIETMDSGGYTYVRLEKDGEKTWLACPKMKVTVGENMSFKPGILMVNFVSKTLKRKFDRIIFSAGPIKPKESE